MIKGHCVYVNEWSFTLNSGNPLSVVDVVPSGPHHATNSDETVRSPTCNLSAPGLCLDILSINIGLETKHSHGGGQHPDQKKKVLLTPKYMNLGIKRVDGPEKGPTHPLLHLPQTIPWDLVICLVQICQAHFILPGSFQDHFRSKESKELDYCSTAGTESAFFLLDLRFEGRTLFSSTLQ